MGKKKKGNTQKNSGNSQDDLKSISLNVVELLDGVQIEDVIISPEESIKAEEERSKKRNQFSSYIENTHGSDEAWAAEIERQLNSTTTSQPASKSKSRKRGKETATPVPIEVPVEEVQVETAPEEQKSLVEKTLTSISPRTSTGNEFCEADEKTNKLISLEFKFFIGKYHGGGLYDGRKSSRIFDYPRSFIEATPSQRDNVDELVELGSNSIFIVTIDHLIDSDEYLPLLVAEPVLPITSFFNAESSSFRGSRRSSWWKHISESFSHIFGDIIHGLIYLHSLGHKCGDLRNRIYVDANGQGKILPLMDNNRKEEYDILNLVGKMKEVITLPFPENEVDESYELPDELTGLLAFVTSDKLKHIPFYWLVNYPYIWSSGERADFVIDLRALIKRDVLIEKEANRILLRRSSFASQDPERIDWSATIADGVFKEVYNRPRSVSIKPYDPRHPIEMIRYMANGYNHVNDNYYRNLNISQDRYAEDEIEASFRSFFPKVYQDLYETLYHYASSKSVQADIFKAFEKWSSLYFARKTPAASIAKGKKVFRLVQTEPSIAKPVFSSASNSRYVDRVPNKQSLSPSLRALSRCAKKLGNQQIVIPMEKEVMNQIQNLYFGKDEINQLLSKGKLDAAHISTYIRLLYEDCVEDGLTKTFGFLCPSRISSSIESKDAELIRMDRKNRSQYILSALYDDTSDGKVYLAAYNIRDHWILCSIDPTAFIVYYLDPLRDQRLEIEEDIRIVVDTALRTLRTYRNQTEKSTTWKRIQCPQQNNTVDCGYYVLRFMREIVDHQSIQIPETYFADCASQTYDRGQINEVRDELACDVLRFYVEL